MVSETKSTITPVYFSTRDLLVMSVLAALGGVTSTYVNALGDAVQAALGFPGGTQWAAGLHVIWIVLAMGILRKPGTGIVMGVLKGAVELLSGNSHGVIILLVNLMAGLLVDLGFLFFSYKQTLLPYLFAGGLATASNVLVFQLFATIPMNILGMMAILVLFLVALVSGLVFAGFAPYLLVNTLSDSGVVKIPVKPSQNRKMSVYILSGVAISALLLAAFLRMNLRPGSSVEITGAVQDGYQFPDSSLTLNTVTRTMDYKGVMTEFSGYPLRAIIDFAGPHDDADTVLLEASDGYAFLISFEELNENDKILLVEQGKGQNKSFDIVGPESSKAWVRNVTKITVIKANNLMIIDQSGQEQLFDPDQWLSEMDSTQVALAGGSQKLQGVPVWKIVEAKMNSQAPNTVTFESEEEILTYKWSDIYKNDNFRIFSLIEEETISFVLADMSGEVYLSVISEIEIR